MILRREQGPVYPRYVIGGQATDGKEAVKKAVSLKPNIVIMDLAMPGLNGFLAMNEIRKQLPRTKLIMSYASLDPEPWPIY